QQQQTQTPQLPQAESGSGSTLILFAGDPFTTGNVVTFTTVNASVPAEWSTVSWVDIRVCNRGHVFAIDSMAASGQVFANTMVRTRAGLMTVAEVVARLESACAAGNISQVAASLGANAAITGSMQTGATTHAFLMVSGESGARSIVAVSDLSTPLSAELAARGITHVRLQQGTAGHVFAVAQLPAAGQPIGSTTVAINGGTMTLADASTRLAAAHAGDEDLVLFTTGPSSDAVIVGWTPIGVDLGSRVNFTGATHASVLMNGQNRVFLITNPSLDTFGNISVRTEGADAGLSGSLFVEVIPILQVTF
ncbi:MAG TPA: hypothetical protein VFW08_08965, partial [bacterium]|nr:hypothetical protein [bacterium]